MPPATTYRIAKRSPVAAFAAVLLRQGQHQRAVDDRIDPQGENGVRRADDLHVEAVGIVPPVVERRRRDHREAAPDAQPRAERAAKAPDANAGGDVALIGHDGALEHDEARRQSGDHTSALNQQMRRRPERVAPDGHVPRDVPVHADHHADGGEDDGVGVPDAVGRVSNGDRFASWVNCAGGGGDGSHMVVCRPERSEGVALDLGSPLRCAQGDGYMLKQRHLFAQLLRLHGSLSEKLLHVARRRR